MCSYTDHSVLGHALLGLELSGESSSGDMNSEDMKRLQCEGTNIVCIMILNNDRFVGSSWLAATSVGCPQLTDTQFSSAVDQCQQLTCPTAAGWYGEYG